MKKAKPETNQCKLYDERGLFLLISPKGGKWWRFKYLFDGKGKLPRVCTRLGTLFMVLLLSGCSTFGPKVIQNSHVEYNKAGEQC